MNGTLSTNRHKAFRMMKTILLTVLTTARMRVAKIITTHTTLMTAPTNRNSVTRFVKSASPKNDLNGKSGNTVGKYTETAELL